MIIKPGRLCFTRPPLELGAFTKRTDMAPLARPVAIEPGQPLTDEWVVRCQHLTRLHHMARSNALGRSYSPCGMVPRWGQFGQESVESPYSRLSSDPLEVLFSQTHALETELTADPLWLTAGLAIEADTPGTR